MPVLTKPSERPFGMAVTATLRKGAFEIAVTGDGKRCSFQPTFNANRTEIRMDGLIAMLDNDEIARDLGDDFWRIADEEDVRKPLFFGGWRTIETVHSSQGEEAVVRAMRAILAPPEEVKRAKIRALRQELARLEGPGGAG